MTINLKHEVLEVIARERPYVNLDTTMLHSIKKNLDILLLEDIKGDPIMISIIRSTWKSEIQDLERELVLRN